MPEITKKYNKEKLELYGITISYIIDPNTFAPVIKIYSNNEIYDTITFNMTGNWSEINTFVDKKVGEIIYKNRRDKIKNILNRNERIYIR